MLQSDAEQHKVEHMRQLLDALLDGPSRSRTLRAALAHLPDTSLRALCAFCTSIHDADKGLQLLRSGSKRSPDAGHNAAQDVPDRERCLPLLQVQHRCFWLALHLIAHAGGAQSMSSLLQLFVGLCSPCTAAEHAPARSARDAGSEHAHGPARATGAISNQARTDSEDAVALPSQLSACDAASVAVALQPVAAEACAMAQRWVSQAPDEQVAMLQGVCALLGWQCQAAASHKRQTRYVRGSKAAPGAALLPGMATRRCLRHVAYRLHANTAHCASCRSACGASFFRASRKLCAFWMLCVCRACRTVNGHGHGLAPVLRSTLLGRGQSDALCGWLLTMRVMQASGRGGCR